MGIEIVLMLLFWKLYVYITVVKMERNIVRDFAKKS